MLVSCPYSVTILLEELVAIETVWVDFLERESMSYEEETRKDSQ